jgi:hypothetical protein
MECVQAVVTTMLDLQQQQQQQHPAAAQAWQPAGLSKHSSDYQTADYRVHCEKLQQQPAAANAWQPAEVQKCTTASK